MINRLQWKRPRQRLRRRLDRSGRQPLAEQLPKQRGRERVTRQNVGQKEGESASATAALAAIGTEHALASGQVAVSGGGIVAVKEAVPV